MIVPEIRTDRLILRAHGLQDYGDVLRVWSQPEVVKHISGVPVTAETAWAKLMFHIGHWAALGFGYWAITARDGAYLGMAGFCILPRLSEPALKDILGADPIEAGWVLDPAAQGQGLAQEAMVAALHWADGQPWPETAAMITQDNVPSVRLAAKLGYKAAGRVEYRGGQNQLLRRARGG
ncbi:GNAT family N-acetyltransferase [Epibacterium ulvae]|uniref:GNAT family N-acetyltransferase n=1 Tax=Epibacterium ulvae TaxID=1156985 RepID=UPI001BFCB319|nr:GNAT family N-acetyltransferase [Epibacterium ulvae]MBT8155372.1 GNAT family N-acetyltransferase [Epibacterium ulvae]